MKTIQNFLKTLSQLGVNLSPRLLLIIGIVVPLVIVAGGFLYMRYQARKKAKGPGLGPSVDMGAGAQPAQPQMAAGQLRKAWNRFLAQLPPVYRRSILNFEHFVVLGGAASGKTRVIDTYTDWKRQTKSFTGSQSYDPDLQVYLASNAVVMEVPGRILVDHSERCHTALRHLWRPLYTERAPTILVVVNPIRLREEIPDVVTELAEAIRAKINVIATIRKQAVEVRVILTHLDEVEGYKDFAAFCRDAGISTRVPIIIKPPEKAEELARSTTRAPVVRSQLEAWLDFARGHLPRALTTLNSAAYRRIVTFLRLAPDLVPITTQFLDTLLAHESLSPDPICGGVYFGADPPGTPNPLRNATEAGPGPDPQRRHQVIALAGGGFSLLFLAFAYNTQHALYAPAAEAMREYLPSTYGSGRELDWRQTICRFTYRDQSWITTHPDFFKDARERMRKKFSDEVRDQLLIPRLKQVATRGTFRDGEIPLPTRRSLYYLALIHSDKADGMGILTQLDLWHAMTDLTFDVMTDYLRNVDVAQRNPVRFTLDREADPYDSKRWLDFFHDVEEMMADGILTRDELRLTQGTAHDLNQALERFDHDDVTKSILGRLDEAANTPGDNRSFGNTLQLAYLPQYQEFLDGINATEVFSQRDSFRLILQMVRDGSVDTANITRLRPLTDRLNYLYGGSAIPATGSTITVRLSHEDHVFDTQKWSALLRNSQATLQLQQFTHVDEKLSIFFGPDDTPRAVDWNPQNDGNSIFLHKATIDGWYTRDAFDKFVLAATKNLDDALGKADGVPKDQRDALRVFVRDRVRTYAVEYRKQVDHFYRSFSIYTPSPEALRVAVSEYVNEKSPFNDFITAVDHAVDLSAELDDQAVKTAGMVDPMRDVVTDFARFHKVVNPDDGTPELAKYRAIMGQLLVDLGPAQDGAGSKASAAGAAGAPAPAKGNDGDSSPAGPAGETLDVLLSPAGRLVLANLTANKGSYSSLVGTWLGSVDLPSYQQVPFRAPLEELASLGRMDIEQVIATAWRQDMLLDIERMMQRFPFDPTAAEEASPKDLSSLFDPVNGKMNDFYNRLLVPISDKTDKGAVHVKRSLGGSVTLPLHMFQLITKGMQLASKLWDATGKPLPLVFRIRPVEFAHGTNPRLALTLVYLNVGDATVFNFNQKPSISTVAYDWTKQ